MLIVVKRSLVSMGLVAAAGMASPAAAQPPSPSPWLPGLPSAPASPDGTSTASRPAGQLAQVAQPPRLPGDPTPGQLYERVRRGVVALEHNGVPLAVGTVLAGDGRVLTALSGLAGADGADVRYADGTLVHAKVGRSDKVVDLALLVPQSNTWTDGLSASEADPAGSELRAMLPSRGSRLGPIGAGVRGEVDAHSRGGEALARMLDVDVKGSPVAGAPLLDVTGRVVAVLVRACKGPAAEEPQPGQPGQPLRVCMPIVLGAPVSTIRTFLTQSPAAPWLGIRGEPEGEGNVHGVRVLAVAPSSPAEKAILKPSDVIVAVDGRPIDTPEALSDVIGRHAAGDAVKLLVFADDKFREVVVALRGAPQAP